MHLQQNCGYILQPPQVRSHRKPNCKELRFVEIPAKVLVIIAMHICGSICATLTLATRMGWPSKSRRDAGVRCLVRKVNVMTTHLVPMQCYLDYYIQALKIEWIGYTDAPKTRA